MLHPTWFSIWTLQNDVPVQDKISEAMDRKEYSLGVFIDVAKAFDTVDHNLLTVKLQNTGISGIALKIALKMVPELSPK